MPNLPETSAVKIDPTVLIVDDSITVRELLSLTFNKAGYRVEQARDGQEAWDKLRSGLPCDIVFCDIEMPRCDGLELLSRIQKDSNLNHLPIAMLTSRGADRHRQMAIQLGASGYFTKPYLEEALLEAAARMLKGEKLVNSTVMVSKLMGLYIAVFSEKLYLAPFSIKPAVGTANNVKIKNSRSVSGVEFLGMAKRA